MNKFIVLISIIIITSSVMAQDASQVGWVSKFGMAGGFTPMYMMPNLDPVKDFASAAGIKDFSSSGLITYGGSGYAYIMIIDNVRLGGIGFSGSRVVSSGVDEMKYAIGGGGLTIEYTIPSIRRIAISPGLILGVGSFDIYASRNNGDFTWAGLASDINQGVNTTDNFTRKITNSYYIISPTLNIDIPFNRFLAFRIGAGYQLTIADEWSVDNDQKISGMPSDLNGNSFFIQTGLFIGFFAF